MCKKTAIMVSTKVKKDFGTQMRWSGVGIPMKEETKNTSLSLAAHLRFNPSDKAKSTSTICAVATAEDEASTYV